MTQLVITETLMVGNLEAPSITSLGSLDDENGIAGMGIEQQSPKPLMAIIYNGI